MNKPLFTFLLVVAFVNVRGQTQKKETVDSVSNPVFIAVEKEPSFRGGPEMFLKFLQNNIKYPYDAAKKGIEGKVFVSFLVEKDGSLTDIKVVRSVSSDIDNEAIRVISKSPKWTPGIQNGRAVRVSNTVAINFKLPIKEVSQANTKPDTLLKSTQTFMVFPNEADNINIQEAPDNLKPAIIEHLPSFPGGINKFSEFVRKRFTPPTHPVHIIFNGNADVTFVVETDGSLNDIKVLNGEPTFNNELIRVIKKSPKWIPGTQNGKVVSFRCRASLKLKSNLRESKFGDDIYSSSDLDKKAEFFNGDEGWNQYFNNNKSKLRQNLHGLVVVSFLVEKNGSISNVEVTRSLSPEADHEAVRLIKQSPKWDPGIKGGEPVCSEYEKYFIF